MPCVTSCLRRLDGRDRARRRPAVVSAGDAVPVWTQPIISLAASASDCRLVAVVVHPLPLILLKEHVDSLHLDLGLFVSSHELAHEELLSNNGALLIYDVVELLVLCVKHLFLIVIIFIILFLIVDIVFSFICVDALRSVLVLSTFHLVILAI